MIPLKQVQAYKTKLRVDYYNKNRDLYEVYAYNQDQNGADRDIEYFLCDENGGIEKHEIYSEMFDDYRENKITDLERRNYPGVFENLSRELSEVIREYNLDDENHDGPCFMSLAKSYKEDSL